MIRRVDGALPLLVQQDVYGTRTAGYHKTYGTETNGVSFYVQYIDGQVKAVLSDAFSEGALTVSPDADLAELRSMIGFLGLRTLLCAKEMAERMRLPVDHSGFVMRYAGTKAAAQTPAIDANDPSFRYADVYALLKTCGFALGAYDAWFADLALRVRRGTADVRLILADGKPVSTASVLFRTDSAAYLGAVATDPDCRGKGLAGSLVRSLACSAARAEILCQAHRVSFYTSLGFQQIGEFSVCRFLK